MKICIYKKFLGFDIGTKYIGISYGQINNNNIKILNAIKITNNKIDFNKINKIIKIWQPEAIIIGIPLQMNNKKQFINYYVKKISKLISILFNLPKIEVCEKLTSWQSKKLYNIIRKKNYNKEKKINLINSYSASIILNNFFIKN